MSTKIYDAYCMKSLSTNELNDFIKSLKNICNIRLKELTKQWVANTACNIIQTCYLHRANPDLTSKLGISMPDYLIKLYHKSTIGPIAILNGVRKQPSEKVLESFQNYEFYTPKYLASDIIENKIHMAELTETASTFTPTNTIVIFPTNDNRTLFLAFGNIITQYMKEILTSQENNIVLFRNKYCIKDYHYQNQTDMPDDISEEMWEKRYKDWETYMPSGIPSRDGISIELSNHYQLGTILFLIHEQDLIKYIPEREIRIQQTAKELTQATVSAQLDNASDIISNNYITNKQIADKCGERYDIYLNYIKELEDILPDITKELLETPISKLISI